MLPTDHKLTNDSSYDSMVDVTKCSILIIEDDPHSSKFLSDFLNKLQFNVVVADTAELGIEYFEAIRPDIILTDYNLPGQDGIEVIRYVRAQKLDFWTSIIVLSGFHEMHRVISCLQAGADDYMNKPVNFDVLRAKITTYARITQLQKTNLENKFALQRAYSVMNREEQLAESLLNLMLKRSTSHQLKMDYWFESASRFSGDLITISESSDTECYILLCDVTGHGLSASFTTLLVSQVFHDMVARQCDMSEIVTKLNEVIYELLPTHIFAAACLLKVNTFDKTVSHWSGGIPDTIVFDSKGILIDRHPSSHPALGIVAPENFELSIRELKWDDTVNLLIYTDGIVESENQHGERFGEEQLIAAVEGQNNYQSMLSNIKEKVRHHMQETPFNDDVTVLAIEVSP